MPSQNGLRLSKSDLKRLELVVEMIVCVCLCVYDLIPTKMRYQMTFSERIFV